MEEGGSFVPRDESNPFTELGKPRGKGLTLGKGGER